MTGPRKRTIQLLSLLTLGFFITTGGPAHSARSRRSYQRSKVQWKGKRTKSTRGYGTRTRRNYSTSVKRARTPSRQHRKVQSAQKQRTTSQAERLAWLKRRSTLSKQMSAVPASRGGTTSTSKTRSASDLNAALARRRAWVGGPSVASDPSSTGNVPVTTTEEGAAEQESGTGDSESGTPAPEEEEELSPAERRKEALIRDALAARGIRYRYGGTSRGGFDCSGFTRWLMLRNLGIKLPHSARAQARYGEKVPPGTLKPGDLVFFKTNRRGISHVGMYVGNNRFIHAPRTGRSVAVDSLTGYYKRRYVTARRLKGLIPIVAQKAPSLGKPVIADVSAGKSDPAVEAPPGASTPQPGSAG